MTASKLLRRTLRPHRQNRAHRPHPDLRRTTSADPPGPLRRPPQRPPATPSAATSPTTPRSPRPGHQQTPNQAPTGSRRADQRVRARRLTPHISAPGRVLEPDRVSIAHPRARIHDAPPVEENRGPVPQNPPQVVNSDSSGTGNEIP